jgi:outer membrane protein TolC
MLEAYAAQESERLLQQQRTIQQAMTERWEQQLAVGEITRSEVIRSQLALNQLELTVSAARKRVVESRVMVAIAIGMPVDALSEIDLDFTNLSKPPVLPTIPVQNLKEIALRTRPDVLAALADYEAAQSALQLEIANQYPDIQAVPGFAWNEGQYRWALGTSLQLPVLHHNQGPIAEAEAKRHELAVRFEALQMRILGEIDRAHAGWTAVLAKWLDAEKHMRIQSENLHSAQDLFRAGENDHLALLGAELEGVVAEQARLNVLVETQQACNILEDTLRYPIASTLTASLIQDSAMRETHQ